MNFLQRIFHRPFFIRLFNWEYWSFSAVYVPVYPIWVFLCIRARSFFFFSASNPRIRNGGFLNESKEDIFALVPARYQPRTVFFSLPASSEFVLRRLKTQGLSYPLVGKPNVGGRGRGVKVLSDDDDVRAYTKHAAMNFHIQEYVAFKNEVGIFYCRYPGDKQGRITGIVRKEFLSVEGNGKDTIRQLLMNDRRGIMYRNDLERLQGDTMNLVLAPGEKRVVSPYGNHARGALFLDDSALAGPDITRVIESICREIPEFYFGRLDIRFSTWEELLQGKNFSIIEVNGAGSEPTHMYDPSHSIFFAWREIVRHWKILWRISRMNHRHGYRYLTLSEGLNMLAENREISRKLAAMS